MGFKDLSTNKKLDAVLENLNDWHTKDRQPHAIKYKYRGIRDKYELITEMGIETEDVYELDLILEYLSEVEHYIVLLGGDKGAYATYRILYEGRVFIENGGYVGRATDESWTRWGGAYPNFNFNNRDRVGWYRGYWYFTNRDS